MADEKVKFDKWPQVEDALKKSSVESDSKSTRLVLVLVCQSWSPPSLYVAKELEKLRSAKLATIKSPVFVLDADDDKNKTWELGVAATPALFFFLGGKPMTVRRAGYADSDSFVGSCSKDSLIELLQSARTAENDGSVIVTAEF